MLLNFSNHPLTKWDETQRAAAERQFGNIVDIKFPIIEPTATLDEVKDIADEYARKCQSMLAEAEGNKPHAIHLMGEFTFTYQFVKKLEALNVSCVASTTGRIVTENPDGSKTTIFKFVQFRRYF